MNVMGEFVISSESCHNVYIFGYVGDGQWWAPKAFPDNGKGRESFF